MEIEELYERIESGEITIDEINNMDLSEFKGIDLSYITDRIAYWDTYQLALKISINSLYGALANTYFLLFNRDVAASITGNGRIFIQGLANYINEKLKSSLKTNKNFVVYGDTDSVVGDTMIYSDKLGRVKISNYFDYIEGFVEERDPLNYVKHVTEEDSTFSISSDGELRKNPIRYVMKHQVQKRMYKITIEGNSVIVTEDHSVMVKRGNEILEIKPKDIKDTDFLIKMIK